MLKMKKNLLKKKTDEFPHYSSHRLETIEKDGSIISVVVEFIPANELEGFKADDFSLGSIIKNGATDLLRPFSSIPMSNLAVAATVENFVK